MSLLFSIIALVLVIESPRITEATYQKSGKYGVVVCTISHILLLYGLGASACISAFKRDPDSLILKVVIYGVLCTVASVLLIIANKRQYFKEEKNDA